MKCPKCGYNSFEYHDSCKRCSADFSAYKETYHITPIVLPPETREEKANEFRDASSANEQPPENVETPDDMFSFALPEGVAPPVSSVTQNVDPFDFGKDLLEVGSSPISPITENEPFSFDENLPEVPQQQVKVEVGGFFDLLESTSKDAEDPFTSNMADSAALPAEAAAMASGSGAFDLENFSWDDTPTAAPKSEVQGGVQTSTNDFDSLFGDRSDSAKK